jgi:RNA polymerase sigma factor (sigma-70 family)
LKETHSTNQEPGTDKANHFMQYINDNYDSLTQLMKKNKTYNPDSFHDTLLKCYEYIQRTNCDINDYKNYFFLSARNNYIINDNQTKNKEINNIPIDEWTDFISDNISDTITKEEILTQIDELFIYISKEIEKVFPPNECMIYILYHKLKSDGKMNYRKMAKILKISSRHLSPILRKINAWVNENPLINNKLNNIEKI